MRPVPGRVLLLDVDITVHGRGEVERNCTLAEAFGPDVCALTSRMAFNTGGSVNESLIGAVDARVSTGKYWKLLALDDHP